MKLTRCTLAAWLAVVGYLGVGLTLIAVSFIYLNTAVGCLALFIFLLITGGLLSYE